MKELLIIGFADKHRALEVLPQLRQLHFDWTADLQNAVAVEVERDGRLKLFQGQMLDGSTGADNLLLWKALLSAIKPLPYTPSSDVAESVAESHALSIQIKGWLEQFASDQNFLRDAGAVLRPDSSALMAIIHDREDALAVISGYSHFVLHTRVE